MHGPSRITRDDRPAVHILDCLARATAHFVCIRCDRRLHESQFAPIFSLRSEKLSCKPGTIRIALHPACHLCRREQRGKWVKHPLYTIDLDRVCKRLQARMVGGARQRRIMVAIDKDDILGLYLQQEGKCALSGVAFDWGDIGSTKRGGRALFAPSLDRIDSHQNYVLGNVQLVANVVNVMKNDLDPATFLKLCRMISEHDFAKAAADVLVA